MAFFALLRPRHSANDPLTKITMECLINPERGRGEATISGTGLLCITPNESMALGRYAKEKGGRRHPFYHATLWGWPGGGFLCGPALGAPMAVMALEKLIALGGRRFVVFGSCGALSPALRIGDPLMPTWAVSQEGTSQHYPLAEPPLVSPHLYRAVADFLAQRGLAPQNGGVWTTDAPYREHREVVRHYQAQGVMAVDMEFSALFTVAAFRQVELAAVMVVSDLLSGNRWQSGFTSLPFKTAMHAVGRTLLEYCVATGK